jgi:phage-related protein
LGYGGTKTEMERLIKDAAELDKSIKANDLSFSNIVKAINVVQTKMGITGTTALEAGRTISGSVGSMKAAWTNLITGLADGNADIGQLVDNLVTTIVGDGTESNLGVLGNVMPAVKTALNGGSNLISKMLPIIIEQVPEIVTENLPILLDAGVNIVKELLNGITENPDLVVDTVMMVIDVLTDAIVDLLPDIIVAGALILGKLAVGLIEAIPDLLAKIPQIVAEVVNGFSARSGDFKGIGKNIGLGVLDGLKRGWESVKKWFSNAWDSLIGKSEDKLEIGSPSKRFKRYGKWTAEGYGIGFENEFADVSSDIEDSFADLGADTDYGIATATSTISSYSGADRNSYATQNVNVTVGIDNSANAMGLARELLPFLKIAEKEVYA